MKGSIIVLLFFVAGCMLGVTGWLPFEHEGKQPHAVHFVCH